MLLHNFDAFTFVRCHTFTVNSHNIWQNYQLITPFHRWLYKVINIINFTGYSLVFLLLINMANWLCRSWWLIAFIINVRVMMWLLWHPKLVLDCLLYMPLVSFRQRTQTIFHGSYNYVCFMESISTVHYLQIRVHCCLQLIPPVYV